MFTDALLERSSAAVAAAVMRGSSLICAIIDSGTILCPGGIGTADRAYGKFQEPVEGFKDG